MKTIRTNVFETNSSSSHSFVLSESTAPNIEMGNLIPDENGVIRLTGGEFGWEWMSYNDPLTKANYCAVYSLYANLDSFYENLVEVILEVTGANEVNVDDISFKWDDPNYSYIDHESRDMLEDVMSDKDDLKRFIFDSESILYTGNDNDCPPPNFYDKPGTVYKYKFSIPSLGEHYIAYLTDEPTMDVLSNQIKSLIGYSDEFELNLNGSLSLCQGYSYPPVGVLYRYTEDRYIKFRIDRGECPEGMKSIDLDNKVIKLYRLNNDRQVLWEDSIDLPYEIEEISTKDK